MLNNDLSNFIVDEGCNITDLSESLNKRILKKHKFDPARPLMDSVDQQSEFLLDSNYLTAEKERTEYDSTQQHESNVDTQPAQEQTHAILEQPSQEELNSETSQATSEKKVPLK